MKSNYIHLNKPSSKSNPIKAWVKNVPLENLAISQLQNLSKLPFIYKHIAVMPDAHVGKGTTIGTVFATTNTIIPAAVGVDIGCGMQTIKTSLKLNDLPSSLYKLRKSIESKIPIGRTHNGRSKLDMGSWKENIPDIVYSTWNTHLETGYKSITNKYPALKKSNSINHLGTLGTGNHFIELCHDENDFVWFLLHSGSRGIGNKIGHFFINKAIETTRLYNSEETYKISDKNLSYIKSSSSYFDGYVESVKWAQKYAKINRNLMMKQFIDALIKDPLIPNFTYDLEIIDCHHNYIAFEEHFERKCIVTRKGALNASKGKLGIIPGSMGERTFIIKGKGNKESFKSCSHGAGRVVSRSFARKHFNLKEHIDATKNVECRKDERVIDETPMAYKDIDKVMKAQADLIEVVHILKQVMCVKG